MNYESSKEFERLVTIGVPDDMAYIIACEKGNQKDLSEGKKRDMEAEQNEIMQQMQFHSFRPITEAIEIAKNEEMNRIEQVELIESLVDPSRFHPDYPPDPAILSTTNVIRSLEN